VVVVVVAVVVGVVIVVVVVVAVISDGQKPPSSIHRLTLTITPHHPSYIPYNIHIYTYNPPTHQHRVSNAVKAFMEVAGKDNQETKPGDISAHLDRVGILSYPLDNGGTLIGEALRDVIESALEEKTKPLTTKANSKGQLKADLGSSWEIEVPR